jgi:hypothetical protein
MCFHHAYMNGCLSDCPSRSKRVPKAPNSVLEIYRGFTRSLVKAAFTFALLTRTGVLLQAFPSPRVKSILRSLSVAVKTQSRPAVISLAVLAPVVGRLSW